MKIRDVPNNNMVPGSDTWVGLTLTSIANALPVVKRSTEAVKIEIPNDFFILFLTFSLNVLNNVDRLIFFHHEIFQFRVKENYFRPRRSLSYEQLLCQIRMIQHGLNKP